ncbi:hypothetical protein [Pseudomonas monteilii]|uniref:hypothetical protein n=1 Tax=Pseudomonas monteilii TaxID=76759 RepID=UPI001E623027|nr:hypothetical protein [Pseudomonas monteilii]MCE0875961.1 hypothetical protein [Pseudomonas monteilii]MCE0930666.1 hypothetical protein [Pseudomonas monteilii]MCE0977322.1 hypothetical protein [Pseudomonas monteilii]MCE1010843.1 hypothetical protein [Pseudomonas monteilii]MCE1039566.1 hypothetical protein [Pseudomonas monteilii]
MQKTFLNVVYGDTTYNGFDFEALPIGAALLVAQQQIEQAADQARAAVLGDPLRAIENQLAEEEAKAFKQAGYDGEVPQTVQAIVAAQGVEPMEAAEAILQEAQAWHAAVCSIRAARLKGRVEVLKATTHAQAEDYADTAINAIRAVVGSV